MLFVILLVFNDSFNCRKLRSYKEPLPHNVMSKLRNKTFSDETMKKVAWVRRMYGDWRKFRNDNTTLPNVHVDIEQVGSFSKEELCETLCHFITEVKKLDGSDFPPHTLYGIIICIQFWLESNGCN